MRPFVVLLGCAATILATATTGTSATSVSPPVANTANEHHLHTIRYVERSRGLKKRSGKRRKGGRNNSLSNAGGRAQNKKNNRQKNNKEEAVVVSSITPPAGEEPTITKKTKGSAVSISTKNGGTVYEYTFTTPGGPSINGDEAPTTDSIVIVAEEEEEEQEEDVVNLLTTTTPEPSTPSPTTSSPTISPTLTPSKAELTVGPTESYAAYPCGISPLRRRVSLMLMATEASGNIYNGTPQKAALDWLLDADAYQVCPDDPMALQRYTLAVFYYSTLGDSWLDCSAISTSDETESTCDTVTIGTLGNDDAPKVSGNYVWLSPVNECMWAGVECLEATAEIIRIEFEGNGLAGTLPTELGHLSELRFLYAEQGIIGGTIPTELGQLSNLLVLDLDYNYLTGTAIPSSFYGLTHLAQLDLNDNLLTGTIDNAIGNLTDLKFLQLGRNPISGTIPEEISQLDLIIGGFENTLITGTMPSSVCSSESSPNQLVADCGGEFPRLVCDCCTRCLETETPAENNLDGL